MKTRGVFAVGAGILLVALMLVMWVRVAHEAAVQTLPRGAATPAFYARTNVAFAAIVVAGVLGIINGVWMITRGRTSKVLVYGVVVLAIAAVVTVAVR